MIGNIHSIESLGTVDGPGVRMVVFMRGCPMRCLYCHNPDTWDTRGGQQITSDEILERYGGIKEFCQGGITVTGGEPLLQIDFVIDLFKKAQETGIHTCLDTSGITFNPKDTRLFKELVSCTSLVLLDIKHIDDAEHRKLTGHSNANVLAFARFLSDRHVPMWIRHVVVPEITDNERYLTRLGEFLRTLDNVKALDILPYHDLGKAKYRKLGISYPLEGVLPLARERAIEARDVILRAMREVQIKAFSP